MTDTTATTTTDTTNQLTPAGVFRHRVTAAELEALQVPEETIDQYTYGSHDRTVTWENLARQDGISAIRTLPQVVFERVTVELIRQGMDKEDAESRATVISALWYAAGDVAPSMAAFEQSVSLRSAVACAMLLRLVEDSLQYSDEELELLRRESFAKQLGVQ